MAKRLMRAVQRLKAQRFEAQCKSPAHTQWQTLERILQYNSETEIGRRHGFANIESVEEFQRRVPIHTAETLAPYIERMARGEPNVLVSSAPHYFCQTGGTTGHPKLSPINDDYRAEYQNALQTFGYYLFRDHPDVTDGQILYFVGPHEAGRTLGNIPYGTMSGYNFKAMPRFIKPFYALPLEVAQIHDYEAKYYTVLRLCIPQDVRMLASITPSTLLVLGRKLAQYEDQLLDDIAKGQLSAEFPMEVAIRNELAWRLQPNPQLAKRLRELRQVRGEPLRPLDVWPHLRVLVCWKSGPSAPYVPELRGYYGDTPVRDGIYSATEAWMNVPLNDVDVGGPVSVGSHFFEFFEEDDDKRGGTPLLAHQLQEGKRYAVVVTASSGVYRYDIKDIVTCVGYYGKTAKIAFSHKEVGFSNIVGEKLSEHHANAAVLAASQRTGLQVRLFAMAPTRPQNGGAPHYVAFVELAADGQNRLEKAPEFLRVLEDTLQEQAWEYASHRKAEDLAPLELAIVSPGSHDRLRAVAMQRGANEAQLKPRHVVDDIELFADLPVEQRIHL